MGQKVSAEATIKDIRRQTRRQHNAEEKIRIVLEGLRGEATIAELCRRDGIAQSLYYKWSKEFLEAGKSRLAGDTKRQASSQDVDELREENAQLKQFCGSRDATHKGLEVTTDTAQQIAELGWVIVSGHARGVDATAHRTALENGAGTIIVAPEGILSFNLRQELKRIAKPERVLIVSEFSPQDRWTMFKAMSRNRTIIGLSDAMILVEARSKGGTFEAGKAALRFKIPLYVVQYQKPGDSAAGNEYFLKRGANVLRKNPETERANIANLRRTVEERALRRASQDITSATTQQLSLAGFTNDTDSALSFIERETT